MLISSSCVRELPCDLLLSSTVLQKKKKKKAVSWLEVVRKQARRERETPFARTEATPFRQQRGRGVKREDHHRLCKERKKTILKFYFLRCFVHLNLYPEKHTAS